MFDQTGDVRLLASRGVGLGVEGSVGYAAQFTSAACVQDTLGSSLDISANAYGYGADFYKGAIDPYIDAKGNAVNMGFRNTYTGVGMSLGAGVGAAAYLPRTTDLSSWFDQQLRELGLPVVAR